MPCRNTDRHHQSKLVNFGHQNFQNIVTWGVELRSRNTIFAFIPMESLLSGVLPSGGTRNYFVGGIEGAKCSL